MLKNCFWRTVLKNIFKQALSFHPKTQYLQFYPKPRFYLKAIPIKSYPHCRPPPLYSFNQFSPFGSCPHDMSTCFPFCKFPIPPCDPAQPPYPTNLALSLYIGDNIHDIFCVLADRGNTWLTKNLPNIGPGLPMDHTIHCSQQDHRPHVCDPMKREAHKFDLQNCQKVGLGALQIGGLVRLPGSLLPNSR